MKMQQQRTQPTSQAQQMEMAMELMVEEAKKQDEMFFKFDLEQDQIESAAQYYMENDNAFKMRMQQKMMQMQMAMGGMMQ